MSQQKEFEGPDVRALLDEICATYGPEPSITRAETFRTGGILGFFQREKFRLVVEDEPLPQLPEAVPAVPPATVPAERRASHSLAQAAYAAISGGVPSLGAVSLMDRPVHATEAAGQPLPELGSYIGEECAAPADPFTSLAEATQDSFVPSPALTTGPSPTYATPLPSAGDGGGDFESVLRRVARIVAEPEAVRMAWPASEMTGDPAPTTGADLLHPPATHEPAAPVEPAGTLPVVPEGDLDLRLALRRVGFGPGMVSMIERATAGGTLPAALLHVFGTIPAAPRLPERRGSLIVVVGQSSRALAEAGRIAAEVGADPSAVAFASERGRPRSVPAELIIRTSEDASEVAPGHRRGKVAVVAVDAPVGGRGAAWAMHVISALRPTMVVGVVDAMYKNEDVDTWSSDLGGIDVLAVDNLEITSSPASLLDLEVPVARIGDQPATALRWAALVLDRIAPDHADPGGETELTAAAVRP